MLAAHGLAAYWHGACQVCKRRLTQAFTSPRHPHRLSRFRPRTQTADSQPQDVPDFVKGNRKPPKQPQDEDEEALASPLKLASKAFHQLLYNYYNYRQSNISDLQLILLLNVTLIIIGAFIKAHLIDPANDGHAHGYLTALYQTILLTFGAEFPLSEQSSLLQQVFSVAVAASSLAGFAVVLALVEQAVLEVIESNVNQGSNVYEKGHVLVLGWCKVQRDMEALAKLVDQLCLAHRAAGGTTVVVLTGRRKLDMEAAFRTLVPERFRFGSKLVFRQGNPLLPDDLHMVAARHAASTIIVSDNSGSPEEADAQALRVAIFLDEMHAAAAPGQGCPRVVVEMQASSSLPLVKYSCSSAVTAISSNHFNAIRLAKMIKRPVLSMVLQRMFNFEYRSSLYVGHFPEVDGMTLGAAALMFPDAIIMGVLDSASNAVTLNPPPQQRLGPTHDLCLLRPTSISSRDYRPAPGLRPPSCDNIAGRGDAAPPLPRPAWPTTWYDAGADNDCCEAPAEPAGPLSTMDLLLGSSSPGAGSQAAMLYLVPGEYIYSDDSSAQVLVCGWAQTSFMADLLRELDHGLRCLAPGSEVLLCNAHDHGHSLRAACRDLAITNIRVRHVRANPLRRGELQQVDMSKLSCAIVLCDEQWVGEGDRAASAEDVLRLDALVMTVQLNIRKLREDQRLRPINIICQKLGTSGMTRFEDRHRLPLGMTVNFTSYAAKILGQASYDPRALLVLRRLGHTADITVVDAAHYAGCNESVSFWELVTRAQMSGEVLLGYYLLPSALDEPVEVVLNPAGEQVRARPRVWHGSGRRLKFIILRNMGRPQARAQPTDEEIMRGAQPATWITLREGSTGSTGSTGTMENVGRQQLLNDEWN